MKILILGATGGTGKHLLEQALAAGHEVTALVRDPANLKTTHDKLHVVKGRATNTVDLEAVVAGQEAVLSTLGPRDKNDSVSADASVALVAAMKKQNVSRLLWLTAGGVGDSRAQLNAASFVFGRIILPLFLAKTYANHEKAEAAIRASGLSWTLLRPVQLVDAPTGRAPAAVLPGEKVPYLKIARKDVAKFMLQELAAGTYIGKTPVVFT